LQEDIMLRKASELTGCSIQAKDGPIGSISDLLFDDEGWSVRWLVVETGSWLTGRKVLLPSSQLKQPSAGAQNIPVDLTKQQVEASPDIDTEKPVTRQMESSVYDYYGWPAYWPAAAGAWPVGAAYVPPRGHPAADAPPARPSERDEMLRRAERGDPHLRSANEVTGYYIQGSDGDIGHVEDFLIDSGNWTIRYIIVDTSNWWAGKQVLIAPGWVESVVWGEQIVRIDRTRQEIKDAPEYDPTRPVELEYEAALHRHYGATGYWDQPSRG
jgi:hypothetical protein